MAEAGSWRDDLGVLWRMARGRPRAATQAASLDAFYGPQAHAYDRFRERLLPGRAPLMRALPLRPGLRVLDLGAGTGRHWEYVAEQLTGLARLELVDLCTPLLDVARRRFAGRANVVCTIGDAAKVPCPEPVDLVVLSYSLSMMPAWRDVLAHAWRSLRPRGYLAVVDFYTLPARPPAGFAPHGSWDRWFWPRWFAHDGVWLRPEAVEALLALGGRTLHRHQARDRVPYLAGLKAPWFYWIGEKPAN
jgi:S-adenosylmethionine-diacylgycerolhomoserine-N-methlytransferase